ncbi:hypothetical protein GGF37_004066 [Kickxella alabastrina]|nr:hypothetical protein GGF37_004066 [Kickxella alabastrina]
MNKQSASALKTTFETTESEPEASAKRKGLRGIFEARAEWSAEDRETGLLRLFRDGESNNRNESVLCNATEADSGTETQVVGVLAVPGYMTPTDFMSFAGLFRDSIGHTRVIRDADSHNHYIIMLQFTSAAQAGEFYTQYNGKTFSPLEPETCYVVFINLVECDAREVQHCQYKSGCVQVLPEKLFLQADSSDLPACPVCLERLDSTTAGLLTILCQHTFHRRCLAQWGDGTCPVCRYSQTAPFVDHEQFQKTVSLDHDHSPDNVSRCHECGRTDDLWICLICGSIGCGRYANAHAKDHFTNTQHPYSMKLESQVVWDYIGDGYVHRLLQSTQGGKVVAMNTPPARPASAAAVMELGSAGLRDEKEEAALSEAQIMLNVQLESQKEHYDIQVARLQHQLAQRPKTQADLEHRLADVQRQNTDLQAQLREQCKLADTREAKADDERRQWVAEKSRLEAAVAKWIKKSTEDARFLMEERAMSKNLVENQDVLKSEVADLKAKIADMEEQVRDLSFFISTQQAISAELGAGDGGELHGATVIGVAEAPKKHGKGKRRIPR